MGKYLFFLVYQFSRTITIIDQKVMDPKVPGTFSQHWKYIYVTQQQSEDWRALQKGTEWLQLEATCLTDIEK